MIEGTDWQVERVVRVVDGDTVRLVRRREGDPTPLADGLAVTITVRDTEDDGKSIRLVNLDTPERGETGYLQARDDLARWLAHNADYGLDLRVITYPGGGFDRLLGDIYVEGDIGNTASQHMLRDRGWSPYVRGMK